MKTIPTALFDCPEPEVQVCGGCLLIAQPLLGESYFNHGVIALVDYNEQTGALGTVMNNPTNCFLHELIDGVDASTNITVFNGGPLSQDRLYFLHNLGNMLIPDSTEFAPGFYVGGDFDAIREYISLGGEIEGHVRFFVGYSGWSKGQLEDELAARVWAVGDCPDEHSLLFEDKADRYWHRTVRTLGEKYRFWRYFPMNLRAN